MIRLGGVLNGYRDRDMAMAMTDFEAAEPAVYIAHTMAGYIVVGVQFKQQRPQTKCLDIP